MIIQWHWVISAFLVGVTLTCCLEIRRRKQTGKTTRIIYILPIVLCLMAASVWLTKYELAASSEETTVFTPTIPSYSPSPTQVPASSPLPSPQISFYEQPTEQATQVSPASTSPQTAVRRLRIPALNLIKPVHAIPLNNGTWNVSELGGDVGWLETTSVHPNDQQAMVFVGHMTFSNHNLLEQGAFADIPNLPYGAVVTLETDTGSHTYLVDSVRRVSPDNTDILYQEQGNSILLLTCADWNPQTGIYENRLLVRASRQQDDLGDTAQ